MTGPALPRLNAEVAGLTGHAPPVRVVQFGTGALLRGLVDDALDLAARAGVWSGRVAVVSQTGSGRGAAFDEQDGLFTVRERGVSCGTVVDETRVVASVSHALSATDDWNAVLALARDPNVDVVVSNTTEIGLTWDDTDNAEATPPASFPAKLAAFLRERGRAGHAPVVVLPTELVDDNGTVLRDLVLRWVERAGWGESTGAFVQSCLFCDTLVDRIVTGTPPDLGAAEAAVGWRDPLMTDTEPYRMWAIEPPRGTDADALRQRLGFAGGAVAGVGVVPDVGPFRLRKVRLLNAAHTLLVPVGLGCGLETVRAAVEAPRVGAYLQRLLSGELVPAVRADLAALDEDPDQADAYAADVLDRFANPFIEHELAAISLQQTVKLATRVVPSVLTLDRTGGPVEALAFGVAAFLVAHRAAHAGDLDLRPDDRAQTVRQRWRDAPDDPAAVARAVLADDALWGSDLSALPHTGPAFADAVARWTTLQVATGVSSALDVFLEVPPV